MSAKRRKKMLPNGRHSGEFRHVRLHHWLIQSKAYKDLSVGARALLVELYALYNGDNNGDLFLSTREAGARLRISKSSAWRLFAELENLGFIRPRERGAFSLKSRHATTWILTEFAFAGQLATKDFMREQPAQKQKPVSPVGPLGPPEKPSPQFPYPKPTLAVSSTGP